MAIRDNDRLLTLDVARGVAALSVVVFHWSHFHQANGDIAGALPQNLPLYAVFWPAYHFGTLGVDFFFVLSGAIFFTKYAHAITERRVTGWQFFVLRFSRLYPLHFATLLLVAALQWALVRRIGHAVIYEANDLPHFVVNLLFIQNWGISALTSDSSFNAPSWSLSIEALLYIVFFALFVAFRYVRPSVFYFLALAAIGMWLKSVHAEAGIARGLWCFFVGGTIAWCCAQPNWARLFRPALYAGTAAIAALLLFHVPIWKLMGTQANVIYFLQTGFFAGVVGCLILWEGMLHRVARPFSFLGDISYSSYLLHFPLQLTFILAIAAWNGTYVSEPFRSPWMLIAFLAVLIPASLLCFRLFEVPARKALRSALLLRRDSPKAQYETRAL